MPEANDDLDFLVVDRSVSTEHYLLYVYATAVFARTSNTQSNTHVTITVMFFLLTGSLLHLALNHRLGLCGG